MFLLTSPSPPCLYVCLFLSTKLSVCLPVCLSRCLSLCLFSPFLSFNLICSLFLSLSCFLPRFPSIAPINSLCHSPTTLSPSLSLYLPNYHPPPQLCPFSSPSRLSLFLPPLLLLLLPLLLPLLLLLLLLVLSLCFCLSPVIPAYHS